jgi:hypothetical protein
MTSNKPGVKLLMAMLFIAMMSLMTINTASAQNGIGQQMKDMTPGQRADYQTNMMKTKLGLDTQQIVKVKALNLKYALKFQPIIKSDEGRLSNS